MTLPPLPKKRQHKEADVTPLVFKWFEENYHKSCAIEVKVDKNKLLPHQRVALNQVANGVFSHKMADMGRRMPFDGFLLKDADAVLVTCEGRQCTCRVYNGKEFTIVV